MKAKFKISLFLLFRQEHQTSDAIIMSCSVGSIDIMIDIFIVRILSIVDTIDAVRCSEGRIINRATTTTTTTFASAGRATFAGAASNATIIGNRIAKLFD